jgi:LysR family transcriptional regulator, glycine cleavage system transcriptional activator
MPERRTRKTEAIRGFERLPLNALRVFEAVASHLGFAAAAHALHVTPAAVSMQVRTLEEYLQVPLFRRTGRAIALTDEGATLLPGVRIGLSELQAAMQQLRQARNAGQLCISTLGSFMTKWLVPRLPAFRTQHPDIDLQVHTSTKPVVFSQDGFHAAIRMSLRPTPGLYNEKLFDDWFVPVCSPALFARHGPLHAAHDLQRYPMLRSTDESWALWAGSASGKDWQESGPSFDAALTLLAAAEQGQGLALSRWSLAADEIGAGRIVRASARVTRYPRSYYFVCPESYLALPKVQHLLAWLREACRAFPGPGIREPAPPAKRPPARPRAPGPSPKARSPRASRGRGGS